MIEKEKGDTRMSTKMNLPKRSEVDKKHTWAIEDLYINDEAWQVEYDLLKGLILKAVEY